MSHRTGPSLHEQSQCRDYESLVELYMRYGETEPRAKTRANIVIEAREKKQSRRFEKIYKGKNYAGRNVERRGR